MSRDDRGRDGGFIDQVQIEPAVCVTVTATPLKGFLIGVGEKAVELRTSQHLHKVKRTCHWNDNSLGNDATAW